MSKNKPSTIITVEALEIHIQNCLNTRTQLDAQQKQIAANINAQEGAIQFAQMLIKQITDADLEKNGENQDAE